MKHQKALIMICPECGTRISEKELHTNGFDIYACSWRCPKCEMLWLSSDGWIEIGNVILPFRGNMLELTKTEFEVLTKRSKE